MNSLTLEDLMNSLSNDTELTKSASNESDNKDCKEECKDEDKEKKGKKEGVSKSDVEKAEEEVTKSASVKEAQLAGAALAKEIMEKVASHYNKDQEMNKQAADAGKALAQSLLTKLAEEGNPEHGIPEGVVPNMVQTENAVNISEQDNSIKPLPTGDGIRNYGTVNEIYDAIVADAIGQGAASEDQVHTTGVAAAEGNVEDSATPNQVQPVDVHNEVEKAAALMHLIHNEGWDPTDAVIMIKQAEEDLAIEDMQIKQAAFVELVEQGIDPLYAQELVKSAGRLSGAWNAAKGKVGAGWNAAKGGAGKAWDATKGGAGKAWDATKGGASSARTAVGNKATLLRDDFNDGVQLLKDRQFREAGRTGLAIAKNPLVYGTAGAGAAAAGGAYALSREKKAALDTLVEQGVDFVTAANLVENKSQELYGM